MSDFRETVDIINSGRRKKLLKILLIVAIITLIIVFRHQIIGVVHSTFESFKARLETVFEHDEPKMAVEQVEEPLDSTNEDTAELEVIYVVTESYINIREDAGVDYPSIATATKGDELIGTGNVKEAQNGRPWYEVYLTEEKTDTGWISSKVSEPKEQ